MGDTTEAQKEKQVAHHHKLLNSRAGSWARFSNFPAACDSSTSSNKNNNQRATVNTPT